MVRFRVNAESPVPPSAQLYEQLSFAIASRQFPPGARLPSVRQLSMETGLHRNTISKVYNQLVDAGMVQARAGSGVYVLDSQHLGEVATIQHLIRRTLDTALSQGYTLQQVHEALELELDRRMRSSARILATSGDTGALALIVQELQVALGVTVQGIPLKELKQQVTPATTGLIVTQRYDLSEVRRVLEGYGGELIPLDIHTYQNEIKLVEKLPAGNTLGLVSISPGILRIAEIFVQSLRGQHLLVLTAQLDDEYALNAVLKMANLIITDETSYQRVAAQVKNLDRTRPVKLHCAENYVARESINTLRRYLYATS
ncbi:GntR family transcriptional regulator [Anthocerotibacter panamensis]|uniref:GntR family transcriptional regulator n=1 Tax=Anthocerotibacter panamensis TaxID=2857077 RepID=UPI001C407B40|nr:GntR family transcriptional regulator [Anthocerotibacter panamensis]